MKTKDILRLNTEELLKTKNKTRMFAWILGLVILSIFAIKIYDFYKTEEFDSIIIIPIVFLPVVITEFIKLKKINAELKNRHQNGQTN